MPVKVTIRLDDIFFTEAFETELERLPKSAWTEARIGEVETTHNGVTYTPEEFAAKDDGAFCLRLLKRCAVP